MVFICEDNLTNDLHQLQQLSNNICIRLSTTQNQNIVHSNVHDLMQQINLLINEMETNVKVANIDNIEIDEKEMNEINEMKIELDDEENEEDEENEWKDMEEDDEENAWEDVEKDDEKNICMLCYGNNATISYDTCAHFICTACAKEVHKRGKICP